MHDKIRALEVIDFIQMLHLTGDFYGQPFKLLDWQYTLLWDIYGTLNDTGLRQYNYAYLEIPKKNGKTELTAAISLFHLVCDPPGGQIYCCAAEKEQASLVYKAACAMREQDPELAKYIKLVDSKKEMYNTQTGTFLKVLSAEAYSKHGLNPTVVIFDELHAQKNRDLWDTMTFGSASARKEPLFWVITTAGDDPNKLSIGWEVHERARRIRDGELIDPTWYVRIYGAPEDANIYDEAVWYAANPSLDVSIPIVNIRKEALAAKSSEASEKLFRWLRLNQWVQLKKLSWLPLTLWDNTCGTWTKADMIGKLCYLGLDLSSTTDLSALAILFPPQKDITEWRVIFEGWIPEEKIKERERRDHVPFRDWVRDRYLNATAGDMVDYDYIEAKIKQVSKEYKVKYLCPDQWNSRMLQSRLSKENIESIEVPQTMAGMSPGMKEVERLLRGGNLTHDRNPVARWCFGNVIIATDGNENTKPMKVRSLDRIDLTVALINAMSVAVRFENLAPVIPYNANRGIIML